MIYYVDTTANGHSCWDSPDFDGQMQNGCAGCDDAAANACYWCGYGHVFTTHSDETHEESGDPHVAYAVERWGLDTWSDHPHRPLVEEDPLP